MCQVWLGRRSWGRRSSDDSIETVERVKRHNAIRLSLGKLLDNLSQVVKRTHTSLTP